MRIKRKGPGSDQGAFSQFLFLKEQQTENHAAGQEHATISATGSRSHTPSSSTFVPVGYLNT
jgi:hypothetical protein